MKKEHVLSLSKVRKSIMDNYFTIVKIMSFKDIAFDEEENLFHITTVVGYNDGTTGTILGAFTKDGKLEYKG